MENDLAQDTEEQSQISEEQHFRRLYDQILDSFLEGKPHAVQSVYKGITAILDSWRRGCGLSQVDFNDWRIICGYIYRWGPHGAGLARCRILEALENCAELTKFILEREDLEVVSLGGGPLNDVIGFISAMSRFDFKCQLNICVIDCIPQWGDFVEKTEKLLREGEFGNVSNHIKKVKSISFSKMCVPTDLPELCEYDVIIICKLINHLEWSDKDEFVKRLSTGLKESAFILLIDSPFRESLWNDSFECLYLSHADHHYSSGTNVNRFGYNDHVTSKARIAVLRKKRPRDVEMRVSGRKLLAQGG